MSLRLNRRIAPFAVFHRDERASCDALSALRNVRHYGYITRCSDCGSWWWAATRTESFDRYRTQPLRRCVHHAPINYQLISPTHAIRNVHAHIRLLPPRSPSLVSPYSPHLSLSSQERKTSQTTWIYVTSRSWRRNSCVTRSCLQGESKNPVSRNDALLHDFLKHISFNLFTSQTSFSWRYLKFPSKYNVRFLILITFFNYAMKLNLMMCDIYIFPRPRKINNKINIYPEKIYILQDMIWTISWNSVS